MVGAVGCWVLVRDYRESLLEAVVERRLSDDERLAHW